MTIELDRGDSGQSAQWGVPGEYTLTARFDEAGMSSEQAFDARFVVYADGKSRSDSIFAELWARGFGLPDLALTTFRRFSALPLFSSSNAEKDWWGGQRESIDDEARKVWDRLVLAQIAVKVPGSHRYCIV